MDEVTAAWSKPFRWLSHWLWCEYWYWRTIGRWPFKKGVGDA